MHIESKRIMQTNTTCNSSVFQLCKENMGDAACFFSVCPIAVHQRQAF